jgi:HSP20 family protein
MEGRHFAAQRDPRAIQGYVVWWANRQFVPPADVIEYADRIVVLVEIAGMRGADISVVLHNRELIISGTRERMAKGDAAFHQVEIGYGDFQVTVQLPCQVDRNRISAAYRDGLLQVELPRHTENSQVTIPVITEGPQT